MQFVINKVTYTVEVREMLTTSDPDDTGHCNTKTKTIELLAGQELGAALQTLSHEVCHAWLKDHVTPRTTEQFCKVGERLLITFYDEFSRQGGRPALAELMGVPFDGNIDALDAANWRSMPAAEKRLLIIRNTICADLSQALFEVFMARCDAAGLDPLRGDCWPATSYDAARRVRKVEMRTTIKAIRRIGSASPRYVATTSQQFCAEDGVWLDVWPNKEKPPHAARCGIITTTSPEPNYITILWEEAVQTYVDRDGKTYLKEFWRTRPVHMLGKCAEAAAFARTIPECDGIYLAEQSEGGIPHPPSYGRVYERRQAAAERRELDAIGGDGPPASPYGSAEEKLRALQSGAALKSQGLGDLNGSPAAIPPDPMEGVSTVDRRWLEVIRRNGPLASAAQRVELLAEIREQSGCFEDENEEGFERMLGDEAKRRYGRRRSA